MMRAMRSSRSFILQLPRGMRPFASSSVMPKPLPGFYRHYKNGDLYMVLGSVIHTETSEAMVLYRAVNPSVDARARNLEGMAFVRQNDMFMGTVEHKGEQVTRFQRMETTFSPPVLKDETILEGNRIL